MALSNHDRQRWEGPGPGFLPRRCNVWFVYCTGMAEPTVDEAFMVTPQWDIAPWHLHNRAHGAGIPTTTGRHVCLDGDELEGFHGAVAAGPESSSAGPTSGRQAQAGLRTRV